jgi:hypothetical protein
MKIVGVKLVKGWIVKESVFEETVGDEIHNVHEDNQFVHDIEYKISDGCLFAFITVAEKEHAS